MDDTPRLTAVLCDQVRNFAQKLSRTLRKPQQAFVRQMLLGILAAHDIKLSSIVRRLDEPIKEKKTEERLSRQMKTTGLDAVLHQNLLADSQVWIKEDTVLAIDVSDVAKRYAQKMEFLAWIRDGSDCGEVKRGYWLVGVVGAQVRSTQLLPLRMTLYSQEADDFESENQEVLNAIQAVQEVNPGKGIWTIDRGGDRRCLLDGLFRHAGRFVIRMRGDRNLRNGAGDLRLARWVAERVKCNEQLDTMIEEQGEHKRYHLQLGSVSVQLPWRRETLRLVVVRGFGEVPLMLLTDVVGKTATEVLEIYLTRWKIEESYRFLKSSYNLEDVRVRHYASLRNTTTLLLATFYFLAVVLGQRFQMQVLLKKVLIKSKRFFQTPGFLFYALADGVNWILTRGGIGPPAKRKEVRSSLQLSFPFGW